MTDIEFQSDCSVSSLTMVTISKDNPGSKKKGLSLPNKEM